MVLRYTLFKLYIYSMYRCFCTAHSRYPLEWSVSKQPQKARKMAFPHLKRSANFFGRAGFKIKREVLPHECIILLTLLILQTYPVCSRAAKNNTYVDPGQPCTPKSLCKAEVFIILNPISYLFKGKYSHPSASQTNKTGKDIETDANWLIGNSNLQTHTARHGWHDRNCPKQPDNTFINDIDNFEFWLWTLEGTLYLSIFISSYTYTYV